MARAATASTTARTGRIATWARRLGRTIRAARLGAARPEPPASLSGARGAALIRADLVGARTLGVLRNVLADEIGDAFLELLETLANEAEPMRVGAVYGRLFALLAEEAELYPEPLV